MTWPVGIGKEFKGVWHLQDHQMTAFTAGSAGEEMKVFKDKESEGLTNFIGNTFAEQLDEDLSFSTSYTMSLIKRPTSMGN